MFLALLLQSSPASNPILGFVPIILIFAIFYFLLFLPMQRQRKAQQKMLRELQPGQTVVTAGGIVGAIVEIKEDDTLIVRVRPDNVKLQIARTGVSGLHESKSKS